MDPTERKTLFKNNFKLGKKYFELLEFEDDQKTASLKYISDKLRWSESNYQWLRRIASRGISHITKKRAEELQNLQRLFHIEHGWFDERSIESLELSIGMQKFWNRPHSPNYSQPERRKPLPEYTMNQLLQIGAEVASKHPNEIRSADQIINSVVPTSVGNKAREFVRVIPQFLNLPEAKYPADDIDDQKQDEQFEEEYIDDRLENL
ncbi:hypothetical protein [Rubinisphaera italica]|uniref:Uncharacterized protein n=1 Tax=Rubinisphaera italica TaxID=2527969 RepID=A0A5C5XNX0_9PLAN|nr:hypothetical protein [Rubinisphaera italica]TWT64249.1 hypothetical protein Pan54_50100 [Rubinisphaera italica]